MVDHSPVAKDSVSVEIQCAAFNLSSGAPGPGPLFIENSPTRFREEFEDDRSGIDCGLDPSDDVRSLEDVSSNKP